MRKSDILIIGNGISGLFAACVAAEKGKKVTLLSYGRGTLTIACGFIDVLGYEANGDIVKNALEGIKTIEAEHPYAKVGAKVAEDALDKFLEITKKCNFEYIGTPEKNAWVPTAIGNFKPTCLVPKTSDPKAVFEADNLLIVGFDLMKDFYAHIVYKNLSERLGEKKHLDKLNVKLDNFEMGRDLRDVTAMDVARWLESEEGYNSFVSQIKSSIKPNTTVIIPPVLGLEANYKILDRLQSDLNCKFVEVSAIPPGVSGLRLSKMLMAYARKLGVQIIEKARAVGSEVVDGKCVAVITENFDRERKFYADKFILATGGIYGGGLEAGIGTLKEPIFDIDIDVPKVQTEWSYKELFADKKQIFAKFGIQVDKDLTPVSTAGEKLLSNVKVVGRSLAGYDFCFEKSGNGVALITAYKAAVDFCGEE